jgi:hypothetical protein
MVSVSLKVTCSSIIEKLRPIGESKSGCGTNTGHDGWVQHFGFTALQINENTLLTTCKDFLVCSVIKTE